MNAALTARFLAGAAFFAAGAVLVLAFLAGAAVLAGAFFAVAIVTRSFRELDDRQR
jgi:cytochrome c-type biogenesis protein CcmH/NrfG